MYIGKTLSSQIMGLLPWKTFQPQESRYEGDYRVGTLPCAEHFRILAPAKLAYRECLRDIKACLSAQSANMYHMRIRSTVKHSNLADANERRAWCIYAEFAQRLIAQARKLYAEENLSLQLSNTVYALDSANIGLCLSLLPCALFRYFAVPELTCRCTRFRARVATLQGSSMFFDGRLHDVNVLDLLNPEPAAIYAVNQADLDIERVFGLYAAGAFIIRAKSNADLHRKYSPPSDREQGIECDQTVALSGFNGQKNTRATCSNCSKDPDTQKTLIFLTNLFSQPPNTICEL